MKKELDNFIIESDVKIDYFDEIVDYIKENEKRILGFFNLDKLPNKITILILSYEPFKTWVVSKYGEILDYVSGDSNSKTNTIRLLTIEDQIKHTIHKDANADKIKKTALHEIVHQCHGLFHNDYRQTIWFAEGLAQNLAYQTPKPISINECDFNELKKDFSHCKGNYSYAYIIVKYIMNNYPKEEIEKLYSNPDYLRDNADNLFEEAKEYINKQYKKR